MIVSYYNFLYCYTYDSLFCMQVIHICVCVLLTEASFTLTADLADLDLNSASKQHKAKQLTSTLLTTREVIYSVLY